MERKIVITPTSKATKRRIRSLVEAAHAGMAGRRLPELCDLARQRPAETAELVVALAELLNARLQEVS